MIVDEICSGDDLRPGYQPLLEACRITGGIIDAVTAAAQHDDIATAKQFNGMLYKLPPELGRHYSRVDWRTADGTRVPAAVPAYIANPVAAVQAALRWAGIAHDGKPVLVRQAERVEPAAPRPIDDLAAEAGSFEDRRVRERAGIEQAVERLASTNMYVPSSGKHPVGSGELSGTKLWLSGHALVHGIAEPSVEALGTRNGAEADTNSPITKSWAAQGRP